VNAPALVFLDDSSGDCGSKWRIAAAEGMTTLSTSIILNDDWPAS
jgi:hypothetical protein